MSYESVVKEDSPKGYWRVGEPSGTTAADSSGNSQTGTYKATPTLGVAGAINGDANTAVTLNGTTQWITVPDSATLDLGDVFTYEAWIKRSATGGTDCIIDKNEGAGIFRFDGEDRLLLRRNSVLDLAKSTTKIADTNWHHVVATKNGATVRIYIDGVNVTGVVTNSTCVNTASALTIGADESPVLEDFFRGSLDEVAVYGTALSEARVKAHYAAAFVSPVVTTTAASSVSNTTAVLNGEVNPESIATTCWFEYGLSEALGSKVAEESAGSGSAAIPKSTKLVGLSPETKYFFRVVAENSVGKTNGSILSFTTSGAAPTPPGLKGTLHAERYLLDPQAITLRHIRRGSSSSPGAKQVLGVYYYPDPVGLNGGLGFQSGSYERKLDEEGNFSLRFANSAGQDGVLHRERFAIITSPNFRPGDEFIEIYRGGELLFVGVPTSYSLGFSDITISGYSGFWLLKKTRETAMGYWASSPRDAMIYYLSLWQMIRGEEFEPETTSLFSYNAAAFQETTGVQKWRYFACRGDRYPSAVTLETLGKAKAAILESVGADEFITGTLSSEHRRAWRAEWRFYFSTTLANGASNDTLVFELRNGSPEEFGAAMSISLSSILILSLNALGESESLQVGNDIKPGFHHVAMEYRDKYIYFFLDGKLVGYLTPPRRNITNARLRVSFTSNATETTFQVHVDSMCIRRTTPFLYNPAAPGDYDLPGAPPPGGLEGHYNLDQDVWAMNAKTEGKLAQILHPSREVDPATGETGGIYQRRLDAVINFPNEATPKWQPEGPPAGQSFSCRWIGAVYLKLSEYDYAFRAQVDDRIRIYIGKTRLGEEYLNDWSVAGHSVETKTGNWIKAGSAAGVAPTGATGSLAGLEDGWYPIAIEYSQGLAAAACIVEYERSDVVGTWQLLGLPKVAAEGGSYSSPAAALLKVSPLGLYQDNVQFESHYEAFQKIASMFGYQWSEVPQSLESGLFPGYVSPVARVGRDTEYVLDSLKATEIGNQGNADDVADAILAEAQGLGDPSQKTQLTLEEFDFAAVGAPYLAQEQESLSDLNLEALVRQRADSLLALHNSVWEEVGARPEGRRGLIDKFPLSGELAEFKWEPGDGLRLSFPEVSVVDVSPRQMKGIGWPLTPGGVGVPSASFKLRPRNLKQTLRKMLHSSLTSQRNYQGQLVKVLGQLGGNSGAQDSDAFSRCPMPVDIGRVIKATFVVMSKSDVSEWTIEVNGVSTGIKFTTNGRFDVTAWAKRDGTNPRCYARGVPVTGTLECQLELLIVR